MASIVDSLTVNILQHSILHAVNRGELHKGCLSYLGSLEKTSIFKPRIRIKQMAWASAAREKARDESRLVSLNKESVTLLSPGQTAKNIPGNLINIDVLMLQAFSMIVNRPNVFLMHNLDLLGSSKIFFRCHLSFNSSTSFFFSLRL